MKGIKFLNFVLVSFRGMRNISRYHDKIAKEVPLIKLLYFLSNPVSQIFYYFSISPNTITTLSNICLILSCIFLMSIDNIFLFTLSYFMSIILDLSDGVVARATQRTTTIGAYYDYVSDRFKIILFILCVGAKYADNFIWITCFYTNSLLIVLELVSFIKYKYSRKINRKETIIENKESSSYRTLVLLKSIYRGVKFHKPLKIIWTSFFMMDINIAFLLIIAGFSKLSAILILNYISVLSALYIFKQFRTDLNNLKEV